MEMRRVWSIELKDKLQVKQKPLTKKIIKTGNSLYVVVPAKFANRVGVRPGDEVRVTYDLDHKTIQYHFPVTRQLSLI